jgi:DamX protein
LDDLLSTEELVDQLTSEAMAGRMVLLIGADPEAVSERLGFAVERLIDFGTELLRFDALQFHSADSMMAELADVLGIDAGHVMVGLKVRGQTGNPLLMVIDNAECLAADARALLRQLATETESGLGVIFGGEPDAEAALLGAGIPLALVLESAEVAHEPEVGAAAGISLRAETGQQRRRRGGSTLEGLSVPWRHLAAVLGLLLLVWLFWPGEGKEVAEQQLSVLELPLIADEPLDLEPEPLTVPEPAARLPAPAPLAAEPAPVPAPAPAPKPSPSPAPTATAPALTGLAADIGYRNEDWLLAQAADRWVLQVAVATSEDAARAMLDRLGRDRSAYYRARRDGRMVFIVLAGTWASRDQAVAGRDKLADEFRQRGPFPREMRAVHSEIIAVR